MRPNQSGWKEYKVIRDDQKAAKGRDTTELQKRHGVERAALAVKLKAERDDIFSGSWKGKGDARNALQSVLATQQAAEKLELFDRHRAERKALQARYKPLPQYKQWKEQPLIVSEAVRPMIDQHIERDRQPPALVQMLKALSHTMDSRHHVTYRFAGKEVFRDEGRIIQVLDLESSRGIAAALATAQQKFGPVLTLIGSPEFKQNAVAVAVANGLTCRFTDPALDALRDRLQTERYQAERVVQAPATQAVAVEPAHQVTPVPAVDVATPLTSSIELNQQAQRAAAPVAEMPVTIPSEIVADTAPMPAHEWLKKWSEKTGKSIGAAVAENAGIAYTVAHIAPDGIVLDRGRTGAVYLAPSNLVLVVGDKVVVNSDEQLQRARIPEQGKDKLGL